MAGNSRHVVHYDSLDVKGAPQHEVNGEPAALPRRGVIGHMILLFGVAVSIGAVFLKSYDGSTSEILETVSGASMPDAASPRRALSIKAKRSDGNYAQLSAELLGAYKIDLLVEPDVEMHLELDGCAEDAAACAGVTWSVVPVEQDIVGNVDFDSSATGASVSMIFKMVRSVCVAYVRLVRPENKRQGACYNEVGYTMYFVDDSDLNTFTYLVNADLSCSLSLSLSLSGKQQVSRPGSARHPRAGRRRSLSQVRAARPLQLDRG
jgi:hypothetical protein